MNWPLVLAVAAAGGAMGTASVLGLTRGIEGTLWLLIALAAAIRLGLQERHRPFAHGMLAGLLGGGLSPLIQAAFFATYLDKNPDAGAQLLATPGGVLGLSPRLFLLALAPLIALASGAILGGATLLVAAIVPRLTRSRNPPEPR